MLAGQAAERLFLDHRALGAANLLTIRGISSIMGDNNPLYVIDGVPLMVQPQRELTSTSGGSIPAYSFGGTMSQEPLQTILNLAIH